MIRAHLLTLLFLVTATLAVHADEPIRLTSHPQLFLDDYLIARRTNLRRDIKSPTKHPQNPLIKQDFPWERRMIQVYGTVLFDEDFQKFRCWYLASESPDASPEYYICYAESADGIVWQKPMVGDGPFGEHQKHNVVIRGGHGISVLYEPDDPDPNRRYKAVGGDDFAWSSDGIRWNSEKCRYAVGKNDTGSSFVRWNNEYLWFVRQQEPETGTALVDMFSGKRWTGTMRGVGLSVSTDFRTWSAKRSILRGDTRDGFPWGQPHALCVTPYGDVLIGLLPMLKLYPEDDNNSFGPWEVQLAVSRDGRRWERVAERQAFMAAAPEAPVASRPWDARFHPSTTMLVKNDVVYVYYFGTTRLHGEGRDPNSDKAVTRYGIGLATLPADRFVSLRPYDWLRPGILETRPLLVNGTDLLLNADVSPENLHVEIADSQGRPLPGFDSASSKAERHDPLRYRIVWNSTMGRQTLKDAPLDNPVSLRISIRDGDFFSLQISP